MREGLQKLVSGVSDTSKWVDWVELKARPLPHTRGHPTPGDIQKCMEKEN